MEFKVIKLEEEGSYVKVLEELPLRGKCPYSELF